MTPENRAGLLARAGRDELIHLADELLSDIQVEISIPARIGTLVLEVREPVEGIRFQLADVLVTEAELMAGGATGWGMRLGSDVQAAVAAATCDLAVEMNHTRSFEVESLCLRTSQRLAEEDARNWGEVAPTEVLFEELDE